MISIPRSRFLIIFELAKDVGIVEATKWCIKVRTGLCLIAQLQRQWQTFDQPFGRFWG